MFIAALEYSVTIAMKHEALAAAYFILHLQAGGLPAHNTLTTLSISSHLFAPFSALSSHPICVSGSIIRHIALPFIACCYSSHAPGLYFVL